MARSLASEGKDTHVNGLVLGAATGSLAGTLLAGIAITSLLRSPTAAFSIGTPLFSLLCGVLDGAVAGVTFVALGRRKTLDGTRRPAEASGRTNLRWFWLVVALGFGMPAVAIMTIAAREKPERKPFPIAGTTYHWPAGTMVTPPEPPGYYGKGHVYYRSSNRYPDPDAFSIIYDGNTQAPLNAAGLPHLQMITSRFDKPGDFEFRTTRVGQVVCNRRSVNAGVANPCGLSFVHRGARWELHFGAHRAGDAEQIFRDAVDRLESFRRDPPG